MHNRSIFVTLLLALLMAHSVNAQLPSHNPLPGTVAQAQSTQAMLTLNGALDRFLQRNLSLEAARYRVEAAQAEQIAARLRPNPTLNVTAENFKVTGDTSFNRLYEVSATYTQPIELGGKRRLRREVADLIVSVAEAQLADLLRQRMFEVKRAFTEVVLARYSLDNALESKGNFDELIKFNQVRFEEGAIPEGELIKVRLERMKFDTAVAQSQLSMTQAKIRLLELLGDTDYSQSLAIEGEIDFLPLASDLTALQELALTNRPDLQLAERNVKLAERRIALERSLNAPDLQPFAGVKRVGVDNTVLFGITIPLRVNNRNQAGIARSIADEKVAQTELAITRNRALAEVESAYRAYETASAQVVMFQSQLLPQADGSRTIALAAYREGATDLLPLLEAQRTRAEVRQQYYSSLYDYRLSILMLESAIGGEIKL